jgi:ATP-binding cassette subfamily B protein
MSALSSLNKYFFKYKTQFILGVFFVLISNYFRILSPKITRFIIDHIVSVIGSKNNIVTSTDVNNQFNLFHNLFDVFTGNTNNLGLLNACIIIFVLAVFSGLFMFLMRQTLIVMSRKIEFDQKNEIHNHYQSMDHSFMKSQSTGDLMNRISEDVSRVRMYTGPAIMYVINLIAIISFCLFFMWQSDPELTIVTLLPLPILAFIIYKVNGIIHRKSEKIQAVLGNITSIAQESFSGIRVIKSFVQEKNTTRHFYNHVEEYRNQSMGLAKTEALYFPSIGLLIGISTLLTILYGSMEVVYHKPGASIGKIAEFVLYIQMLTFPVSAIGWTASMIQRASASQKRINAFLEVKAQITDPITPEPLNPNENIIFDNVNYTYDNTGIHAIQNLNLVIKKGEKLAIVGKIGSGKSTFAKLVLRFLDPVSGEIRIGKNKLNQYLLTDIRKNIGYVPQDQFLFSDSILENIRLGNPAASENDVKHFAKMAGIDEEIMSFSNAYQTVIGERGITLSGGQKQRISIARALIKNPPILLMDDSLSAIDAHKEQDILNNLNQGISDKTVIVITHRFFANLHFDRILVFDEGRIVEQGNHDDLMNKKGIYYDLYLNQQSIEDKSNS